MPPTPRPRAEHLTTFAVLGAGVLIGLVGLAVGAGWILHLPHLTSWKAGLVPMSPITAVLCLLVGAATALCAPARLAPRARDAAMALNAVAAITATLVLVLRTRGVYLPWEHLGLSISGSVNNAPIGYTSWATALSFLALSGALLTWLARLEGWSTPWFVTAVGSLVGGSGTGLVIVNLFIGGSLYRSGAVPPSINTAFCLLLAGLALVVIANRANATADPGPSTLSAGRLISTAIFGAFVMSAGIGGYAFYQQQALDLRGALDADLHAVSELRLAQLHQWRQERDSDAAAVFHNRVIADAVSDFLDRRGGTPTTSALGAWLAQLSARAEYDQILLLDTAGRALLSIPALPPTARIPEDLTRSALEALREAKVTLRDFYLDVGLQQPRLAMLIPVLDPSRNRGPVAVLVIRIDPKYALYPLLAGWPTASQTAETELARREGDDVLYLNNLRFDAHAALQRRIPLRNRSLLAAQAILGQSDNIEGIDYRGQPVIGVALRIPDSPWYLISRIDRAEVLGELRTRLWFMLTFVGALVFGVGSGLAWLGRRQRQADIATSAALHESAARLSLALRAARQGTWDLDVRTGEIVVTTEYASILGYDPETFRETRVSWMDRLHPDDQAGTLAQLRDCLEDRRPEYRAEFRVRTKDGHWKWLLSAGRVVSRTGDGQPRRMLGTVSDISEGKLAEELLRRNDAAIRASLHEKEVLLQEVHHRVKNNLQLISSLLQLESGRTADSTVHSVLGDMQNRILSMALLHETLYQSTDLARVDLAHYLSELSHRLFQSLAPPTGVTLHLEVTPVAVGPDQAIPCGLVVNELLSNALKHGFPDGRSGEIRVSLHPVDAGPALRLEVSDDGVGLPVDIEQRRSGSLGLHLASVLAKQLQGTLDIGAGPGAQFVLVFTPSFSSPDTQGQI